MPQALKFLEVGFRHTLLHTLETLGVHGIVLVVPDLLGHGRPRRRAGNGLAAEVLRGLRFHQVGSVRTGFGDEPAELVGVLEHGAGPQVIVVERLVLVVFHEQRRFKGLEQRDVVDVDVAVVDEHAGLNVARGVDVQVAAAAGDAASHELAIVLEVHGEQLLLGAHVTHEVVHALALLGSGHERGGRGGSHGHVVEVPAEQRALLDHPVHVRLGGHGVGVLARPAAGDAERQAVFAKQVHGALDLGVRALAAASVGRALVTLGGDGGNKVAHVDHLLAERLVDEGRVGEAQKGAILVLFTQADEVVLAHERLAAGVDVDMAAELLALADDGVDILEGKVERMPVLGRPAARATQVAGARGVEQDRIRDVALMFFAHPFLLGPCQNATVHNERLEQLGAYFGVEVEDSHHESVPVIAFADRGVEGSALRGEHILGDEFVHERHDGVDVLLGVLVEIVDDFVEGRSFRRLCECHAVPSFDALEATRGMPTVRVAKTEERLAASPCRE